MQEAPIKSKEKTQETNILCQKFDECPVFGIPEQRFSTVDLNMTRGETEDVPRKGGITKTPLHSIEEKVLHPSIFLLNVLTCKSLHEVLRHVFKLHCQAGAKGEVTGKIELLQPKRFYLDHRIPDNLRACLFHGRHVRRGSHVVSPSSPLR